MPILSSSDTQQENSNYTDILHSLVYLYKVYWSTHCMLQQFYERNNKNIDSRHLSENTIVQTDVAYLHHHLCYWILIYFRR